MTDQQRLGDPIAAARRQPRGAGLILRHYNDPYRDELAYDLARIARANGLVFLVAGDPALAARSGANGCHLPQYLQHIICRAKATKPGFLVTAAAHSFAAIRAAQAQGADAALVSPIFATESHPKARPLGPIRLAAWANAVDLPLYALGGVTKETAPRLAGIPLAGLAGISGF